MKRLLIAVPYLWLLALFLVPFLIVLKISLSDIALARPPYFPQWHFEDGASALLAYLREWDFENYVFLTTDDLYWKAYLSSARIAFVADNPGVWMFHCHVIDHMETGLMAAIKVA